METSTRNPISVGIVVLVLLAGIVVLSPAPSSAATKTKCQPIVKKIFQIYEGPPFYKAKVLLISGSKVTCSEARKVLWRSLQPGGYYGHIRGWECKGTDLKEKCIKEDPEREVIKTGVAKPCQSCTASER